ncbi:myosin-2 [Quercus suber]|uniref:Myosin-2 n=1 Tax=Quercus suber TaxID=58331 RepID=A0AAW0LTQ4_QUESU
MARSSLEEMLDSLRRRDESDKPKDMPPALPSRPLSRARLPSARRSLPNNFKVGDGGGGGGMGEFSPRALNVKEEGKRKESDFGTKRGSFGSKKMKKDQNAESPYALEAVAEEGEGGRNARKEVSGSDRGSAVTFASPPPTVKSKELDWNDNIGYFIKKKLHVWCQLPSGQWESGTIQSTLGEEALVSLFNGNVIKVLTGELIPANPDILDGVDDLIQLSYLNEPSVLYNLRYRYSRDMIYSKAGPVLIAVNPFKVVQIYGNDFVTAYRQKLTDAPHVYAIADSAYNEMMRDEVNQSIIIRLECLQLSFLFTRGLDYELDGVDWTKVEFEDNQECLDLFEKKPLGLLTLLDEESNFPKATDLTFASKLKQHLNSNSCFKGERGRAFSIRHYAGEVLYDTNGFLEKNRDPLPADSIRLLSSCSCQPLQLFSSKMPDQSQKPAKSCQITALDPPKQSVGAKFKGQLFKLMQQLENTTPHFIRCIKPNSKQLPGIYEEDLVMQQLRCCGVLEVVRISRSGYPTRMAHQQFAGRYGFLLSETNASQDPLSISVAVLKQFNVLPEMYQVGYTKVYLRTGQIGALENIRKQALQGILGFQKCFRGHQARRLFHELKEGVTTLQSFVRGENARRKYNIMIMCSTASAPETLDELHAAVHLQSVIRGWLVRRHVNGTRNLRKVHPEKAKSRRKPSRNISEVKDIPQEQAQVLPSALAELQTRVLKAEATLQQKEEENTALREQLQQSETRWSEYEEKMKSMEETWQKQMVSLQMSLAAARKSLDAENATGPPRKRNASSPPQNYESEDNMSIGSRTPGESTPIKLSGTIHDVGAGNNTNGSLDAVSNLVKEFEQQRQTFDDEAKAIVEVKSGQSASTVNPDDELRKLKFRFEMWKKEYKVRLRETKTKLHKLGHPEGRRKWWGKRSLRAS